MSAIVINENTLSVVCYWNGVIGAYTPNTGDIAIPCPLNADPNDSAWLNILNNPVDLAEAKIAFAKERAIFRVDQMAGDKRMQYITFAPGQDATYTSKLADAKAYIAAEYPANSAPYPWVHEEAMATGKMPGQVAYTIVQTASAWMKIGAKIEGARLAAKKAITLATTIDAISAAIQQLESSLNQIP